ncbi:hypothetical protein ACFX2H_006830 [Malus domestica]
MGYRAINCPQSQQRPQQPFMRPAAPIQQVPGSGSYGQMGQGGAYHYQGDAAPYTSGHYQYSQDLYYHSGYSQYPRGYTPYPPISAGGS